MRLNFYLCVWLTALKPVSLSLKERIEACSGSITGGSGMTGKRSCPFGQFDRLGQLVETRDVADIYGDRFETRICGTPAKGTEGGLGTFWI